MFEISKIIKQNHAKKNLVNDNLNQAIIVFFITLVGAFIYQSVLQVKIYLPGLYLIPQTISYQFEKELGAIKSVFQMQILVFYLIGWVLNLPLMIFAYYKINKRYAIWTFLSLTCYTIWGVIFSLNVVENYSLVKNFRFTIDDSGDPIHRTKTVEFYLIALVAGVLLGLITSVLWKKDISGGGFDIIYTYFAIKKQKPLQKIIMPVGIIVVTINILCNELILNEERKIEYLFYFLVNSSIFNYFYSIVLDYFYPKFQIVTIIIVSKELIKIEKELFKNFQRTATVIKGSGFYQKKATDVIMITATFLEKNVVVELVQKIDKNVFVVVVPTIETHGNFNFKF